MYDENDERDWRNTNANDTARPAPLINMTNRNNSRGFLAQNCQREKRKMCISVVVLTIVIASVLLAYTAFASPTPNNGTLLQVFFLTRHGERTPIVTYPNDPYKNYPWPGGLSALTTNGMRQMYDLGLWIRKNYDRVLNTRYYDNNTLVMSSYATRCVMSAQAMLAAIYPPSQDQIFVPGLNWVPVPVYSTPRELDTIIVSGKPCPALDELLAEAYKNETDHITPERISYYKKLSEHTGGPINKSTDVEYLYGALKVQHDAGLVLPTWTKDFFNEEMVKIALEGLEVFTSNTLQKRLRAGPLLGQILKKMKDVIDNQTESYRKANFYSAHDVTIVNVMRTMGFDITSLPRYGATIIFELHSANGGQDHEVKVKYLKGTGATESESLTVPNCEKDCTVDTLYQIWKDILPLDRDKECVAYAK